MAKQRAQKGKVKGKSKSKINARGDVKKSFVTYSEDHPTLIVGDGDFSFSRGLTTYLGSGSNITATSYDSHDQVVKKYGSKAEACIEACKAAGAAVKHGVDAGNLQPHFGEGSFKRVIFNFPHTGQQRVHVNRAMVAAFFTSARPLLTRGGEVHVTLKLQPPYSGWGLPELAQASGYVHFCTKDFDFAAFPGYLHKTTEAGAVELDTGSGEARRAIKTLIFRRIAGQPPGGSGAAPDAGGVGAEATQAAPAGPSTADAAAEASQGKPKSLVERIKLLAAAAQTEQAAKVEEAPAQPTERQGAQDALKPAAVVMKKVGKAEKIRGKGRLMSVPGDPPKRRDATGDAPAAAAAAGPQEDGTTEANADAGAAGPAEIGKGKEQPVPAAADTAKHGKKKAKAGHGADGARKGGKSKAKADAAAAPSPAEDERSQEKPVPAPAKTAKAKGAKKKPQEAPLAAAADAGTAGKTEEKMKAAAASPAEDGSKAKAAPEPASTSKERKRKAKADAAAARQAEDGKGTAKVTDPAASPAKDGKNITKPDPAAQSPAKSGKSTEKVDGPTSTPAEDRKSKEQPVPVAASPAQDSKSKAKPDAPDASPAKNGKRKAKSDDAAARPAKDSKTKATADVAAQSPAQDGKHKGQADAPAARAAKDPKRKVQSDDAAARPAKDGKKNANPAAAAAQHAEAKEAPGLAAAAVAQTDHIAAQAAVKEEVHSSQVEPQAQQGAVHAGPALNADAGAPVPMAAGQTGMPADMNGQAQGQGKAVSGAPSPKKKGKATEAFKRKADWYKVKELHRQSQQVLAANAKQAFLEYMSSQWDLQVQRNNPTPWDFVIEKNGGGPGAGNPSAAAPGKGPGKKKKQRRKSTGGQVAQAAQKRPRMSE